MSKKKYYCSRANGGNGGGCEYGGNKTYNYGFISGTSMFCRLNKKFLDSFSGCPKEQEASEGSK